MAWVGSPKRLDVGVVLVGIKQEEFDDLGEAGKKDVTSIRTLVHLNEGEKKSLGDEYCRWRGG